MPLWSDDAEKERGLVLPVNSTITYRDLGPWDLPQGTVLIKSFLNPFDQGTTALETRFLVRGSESWRWATYRWDADQQDAQLLTTGAEVGLGAGVWSFPSRGECGACHTEASDQVLGFETQQLRRDHDMFGTGLPVDQVDALVCIEPYFVVMTAPVAPHRSRPRSYGG